MTVLNESVSLICSYIFTCAHVHVIDFNGVKRKGFQLSVVEKQVIRFSEVSVNQIWERMQGHFGIIQYEVHKSRVTTNVLS